MTTRLIAALFVTTSLLVGGCSEPTASEPATTQAVEAPKTPDTPAVAETPKTPAAPTPAEAPKPAQTPVTPSVTPLPAIPAVFRVNCGGFEPYTDKAGKVWVADQDWQAGKTTWGADDGMTSDRTGIGITGTDAPSIYETERYSMSAYRFVVPNGKYTVRLHFCETFEGITAAGERVFSVSLEGQQVLKDLDVFKEAGGALKPLVKEFKGVAVADGQLNIEFTPNIENPEINGIEIMRE